MNQLKITTAMFNAINFNDINHLKYIMNMIKLQTSHDDFLDYINCINSYGWTPLHLSSYNGHLDIIKYLLVNGADINSNNNFRGKIPETPLYVASQNGKLDIVKYLFDNGADINSISNKLNFSFKFIFDFIKSNKYTLELLQYILSKTNNAINITNELTKNYGFDPTLFPNFYCKIEMNDIKILIQKKKQYLDDGLKEHNIPKDLTNKINEYLYL